MTAKFVTLTTKATHGVNAGKFVTWARPMTNEDLKHISKRGLKCGQGGFHICEKCATHTI